MQATERSSTLLFSSPIASFRLPLRHRPTAMLKLLLFFLTLRSLHLQHLAAASQEELASPRDAPLLVLTDSYLRDVSGSVLKAEAWLRVHVLPRYPASGTTAVVVGDTISCTGEQEPKLGLVLLSLKNIHHSLKWWGLEKEIKLSVSLSPACLIKDSVSVRSVLKFLESVNSTYNLDSSSVKSFPLPEMMRKFGALGVNRPWEGKTMKRKLYSLDSTSKLVKPYPARPSPLPEIPPATPFHSSVGFTVPAHIAKSPHPPSPSRSRLSSPPHPPPLPPLTFPSAPEQPPVFVPAMAPLAFTLPPCSPPAEDGGARTAPSPGTAETRRQRLWCVAKPSVPEETLQEAMDYACGEGGGDCGKIMPSGSCYYPNTVIAHASYAFNSYWQKNKRSGGTCSFSGTAMLINADPSFLHCKFELS